MRFNFRYPAVLRYPDGPRQLARHHVWTRCREADVSELHSTDAPVVMRYSPAGGGDEICFRLVDGKLFGLMNPRLSNLTCRTSPDYPTKPLVEAALSRLNDVVGQQGPDMVRGEFHEPTRWPHERGSRWHPAAEPADVLEWETRFEDLVSSMFCVDGQLWREMREPFAVVYRSSSGWHTGLADEVSFAKDLQRFHFPAHRWDDAVSFCERMATASGRSYLAGKLDLDRSWTSSRDGSVEDVMALAARYERHVSRQGMQKLVKKVPFAGYQRAGTFNDIPTALWIAYAELRRVLDLEPTMVGEDDAVAVLESLEVIVGLAERPGMSWLTMQPEAVRAHLEKWNARPIDIPLGETLAAPYVGGSGSRRC